MRDAASYGGVTHESFMEGVHEEEILRATLTLAKTSSALVAANRIERLPHLRGTKDMDVEFNQVYLSP